jgi:PKD repeat protein
LFAGCLALVVSFTGVVTGFGQGAIQTLALDYYPGPCAAAPSALGITFEGRTSGCTQSSGTCIAGEEIVFNATESAGNYEFQTCDRFVWTFGDGKVVEAFAPNISYKFPAPGARTVRLTVRNSFGEASVGPITVPNPSATTCGTGTDRLCLKGGRFRLTIFASDPLRTGRSGTGTAVPENDQFGYFNFFPALTTDPNNLEVFVKVLGPLPDGSHWVFFGGLTDLQYNLTVFDTQTGITESYVKQAGESQAFFDVPAFSGSVTDVIGNTCSPKPVITTNANESGSCTQGGGSLCLLSNRFKLTLVARNGTTTGPGVAVRKNDSFGYFTLPALTGDTANPEVFVKMLDARAIGSGFWVFGSGLTSFQYDLKVTDTQTGRTRTFSRPTDNAADRPCGFTDTEQFPGP